MSPSLPTEPLAKGRKSQATRWHSVLPTGPSLNSGQEVPLQHYREASNRSSNDVSRAVPPQVASPPWPVPQIIQHAPPQPQLPVIQPQPSRRPVPQSFESANGLLTPYSWDRPLGRSQTPSGQVNTSLNKSLMPPNRPRTPLSRPQTPQSHLSHGRSRPPSIVVPPSPISQRVVAYNPSEPSQPFENSPPIAHGRRNLPVQASPGQGTLPLRPRSSAASFGPIPKNLAKNTTYMSLPRCKRGLLIIGSSHQEPTPYTTGLAPLQGVQNDRDMLRRAFQERQYSVETMVEEEGNKADILRRVGNFLVTAEEGDIRMVVFTGHAAKIGSDRQVAIIPHGCSSDDDTISSAEWQATVIKNATAGAVVVSVFATCMSGAMVEQSVRLTNFDQIVERQSLVSSPPNGPIQIVLSSSGDIQNSFEYHTPPDESGSSWHDYFLWALAETTRRPEIDNWDSFVKTLQYTFNYVRAVSFRESNFQYPQDLNWLLDNPQTPRIFVSSRMPDFNNFLPRQNH